ncbi:MAG: hypothetical protein GDA38_02385 [Hormoscilla sp. SP12CHS1]|nr:hypothetical protein [Hormoscilla sp. SP12CHS1]
MWCLFFTASITFPWLRHAARTEVRRILLDRGARQIKIVGYTHGSHWDPTDTFREIFYPGMGVTDLGNVLCLDLVLMVSRYFREVLLHHVGAFSTTAAAELDRRIAVTGLPINNELMDHYYTSSKADKVQIVFNHSPTPGKALEIFFRIMEQILPHHDVRLVVTRQFDADSPGREQLQQLQARYGDRVIIGNTMSYLTFPNEKTQIRKRRLRIFFGDPGLRDLNVFKSTILSI